jgi:hypothetical protein
MTVSASLKRLARQTCRLGRNCRGASVVEFALIGPMFILVIFIVLQIGMIGWAKSSLETAVRDAARFAVTGATGTGPSRDASIIAGIESRMSMFHLVPGQHITLTSKSYPSFADMAQPEKMKNDANSNGVCDAGDTYFDYNGNGIHDADMAKLGYGGPDDVVMYNVTFPLDPIVPASASLFHFGSVFNLQATAAVQNEPFGTAPALAVLSC